jgi:FixJ family two-component response regulator
VHRGYLLQIDRARRMKVPVISIVDDDESVRKATTNFVRSLGYVATTFASAQEFLAADCARDTDCLITDLQMPGMTGLELQTRLIADGHRLPIIFISAFPEAKARGQALAAGAIAFLDKPFSDDKLITHLNEALARH